MRSEALARDEWLPAEDEARPAYGEPLAVADVGADVTERFERGSDWPVALAIFTPVIAVYTAIGYGLYMAAGAAF